MKKITDTNAASQDFTEFMYELTYLRRQTELDVAKILLLDKQSMAIRYELEQKRRGFSLMADLAVSMAQDASYEDVFVAVSRRLNAALGMQRTVVLAPLGTGMYGPVVLQGYSDAEAERLRGLRIVLDAELLNSQHPVVVTGADPETRFAAFRSALELPFLISSPVMFHNEVVAVLVTGRLFEQSPYLPRLGESDVESVQTVSSYLAAMLAGQRLAEAEERAHIMLDATPLCCNFWDEDFNNIDCNQEAARLFGLASKQEYLARFRELSPEYQPDGMLSSEKSLSMIGKAFKEGLARFEWMHQKPSGERIPAEITLVRVRQGDRHMVVGYTRDLREQKTMLAEMLKTQDELRAARDLAEENVKAKSEFLANMSHEIRTPMNAILGMTHLLGRTELDEKQQRYVKQAEHSATLLLGIINDILDFSKIDAGRMEIENTVFSLRNMVRHAHDIQARDARAKNLRFFIRIDPEVPDSLVGDPLRLEQVLLNLLSNAVKFTPEKGEIILRITKDADVERGVRLLVAVEDTGIGLSQKAIANLFKPFMQADTSTTRKYGGTGLGLAISRNLVELMQGRLWCESELGKGSTFAFTATFALAPDKDANSAVGVFAARNDDECSLDGMRVLLVEDNEINQMIAVELLEIKNVSAVVAGNGIEALRALEKATFDVILMDIQMPEMDGLTATKHIRNMPKYKNMPIIAMTAHAMVGDREASLAGGMNDHITKPIDPEVLYAALRRWDRRQSNK